MPATSIVRLSVLIAAFTFAASVAANAHAMLDHAVPAVGSSVSAPKAVILTFSEGVEPAFSHIEVTDAKGRRVDGGKSSSGAAKNELRTVLKGVGPGRYTVKWSVLSVDTHKTSGSFSFQVGP